MKIFLSYLTALASANERKFTNKPEFMEAPTPAWWSTKPATERMATLECKRADYFSTYFGDSAQKVQQLWEDAIVDIEVAVVERGCFNDTNGRKRRNDDDAEEERGFDPCTDWKKNLIWKDTDFFATFIGTFVREVIYRDSKAHCKRIATRLVSTTWQICFQDYNTVSATAARQVERIH